MYVKYLPAVLQRESSPNVSTKVINILKKFVEKVGGPYLTYFVSDNCYGIFDVRKKLVE